MTLENNNTVTQREHPAFEDDYIAPHRRPSDASDRLAFAFVKALRFVADRFFAGRYGHRAVVLETVAAVPGMVGGLLQHLKALRHIRDDRGWIKELLEEAETEGRHLRECPLMAMSGHSEGRAARSARPPPADIRARDRL